jgi:hypothetical protein
VLLGVLFEIELLSAVSALKLFSPLFQFVSSFRVENFKHSSTFAIMIEEGANLVPPSKDGGSGSERELHRA